MKNSMKRNILIALLAIVTLTCWAQEKSKVNPGWLWEISGNGLAQKSYLFGTCHGEGHNFTNEEIYGSIYGLADAVNQAETLFLEVSDNQKLKAELNKEDMEKFKEMMDKLKNPGPESMMPEGVYYKPFFDSLSHFNEFHSFMTYKMKDPEYWKKNPSYWSMRLSLYFFTMPRKNVRTVDGAMREEFLKRGKEVGGLESSAFGFSKVLSKFMNISSLDTMSMKNQVNLVYAFSKICNNDSLFQGNTSYKNYLVNDTCYFSRCLQEGQNEMKKKIGDQTYKALEESREYENQHLLKERNEAWIPIIRENIAQRPCLIAVGCKHLMGDIGLIAMLRRKGYTVTPVF